MALPILVYHHIASVEDHTPFRSLFVHPKRFKDQMKWLKRLGYKGLSMRDAIPYMTGKQTGKVVVITFDDGFVNVLENAAPVLAEYGFTATNYFVAGQIGGGNVWDRSIGIPNTACMSKSQMREWMSLGHEVGAHTLDHVNLNETSDEEAFRQISGSKISLENLLGLEVPHFCYPYGANKPIHREMVRKAGFRNAVTTVPGRSKPGDDPFGLPRIYIRRNHSIPEFLYRVKYR
ncbi:peptidoglycan/xylan/chitin deacetylase (PgdA/CDA1 family) [Paenochrobactrum gallinarii]|uniref:Chitooligosaccharide deacetylase n=1 Tax=Paenochrobactrum gallinarii TaxID=643673 RepID=A0A841M3B3_9HYPH|nr:polysaccharide deacetylase family protein [Paenochrobactrum gallinarii]MBB6262259.1 peptidoglycan/xylan/chitin deacetylase (PgdA/CDA1 family) [Paenochrobactrum gallinarii]